MATQQQYSRSTSTSNTDLFIPRVDPMYCEDDIRQEFSRRNIGRVDYMDFSKKTDVKTGKKYYSVFIKLEYWYDRHQAMNDFDRQKQLKLFITETVYWLILPNHNPIERSRVNSHQLAAYTDNLFDITGKMDERIKAQDVEIAQLKQLLQDQSALFQKMIEDAFQAKTSSSV